MSAFRTSILDTETISFVGGKWQRRAYLDSYPFPFYVVVQDFAKLPDVLSDTLQQWVEMVESGELGQQRSLGR